jgi:signal transduction histidine kinase
VARSLSPTRPDSPLSEDGPLADLVHDLRTPLAIVAGFAELLERRSDHLSPEEREDYILRIREAADRMNELLDEALGI